MSRKPKSPRNFGGLVHQARSSFSPPRAQSRLTSKTLLEEGVQDPKRKSHELDMRMKKAGRVLVINTGATSTKLAVFFGIEAISQTELKFTPTAKSRRVIDELPARLEQIKKYFSHIGFKIKHCAAVMARGGLLALLKSGIYKINEEMLEDLRSANYGEHASNLSALIAYELVKGTEIPAFICDPVVVDEFEPLARISGFPGIERASRQHALNVRAVAKRAASQLGVPFERFNAVCAHLGSGFSIVTIKHGKLIDNADGLLGEGPFSVERAGVLPLRGVLDLAYRHKDRKELELLLSKKSGLVGYLGTNDFQEVERRIKAGDMNAKLIFDAMVYQIAKNICAYSAPLKGTAMAVLITGALAKSKSLVREIKKYVYWIAPHFLVFPGENEMEALRDSAYAVLLGEEKARKYKGEIDC